MNQQIKNILEKQFAVDRLSHAYLFVGPKGVGKRSLAVELAGKVLGIASSDEDSVTSSVPKVRDISPLKGEKNIEVLLRHPDYSQLDCLQDASAESVREFIGRMALKPFAAKRKFALIANIENLNAFGANALLKTLEEPSANTVIVLTANTRRVLPTIISRCQVFNFNRNADPSRVVNTTPSRSESGHPSLAGGEKIADFAGKSLSERLIAINQLADLEENDLKEGIETFIYESADALYQNPQDYARLAAGLKAFEDLNTNKNRKLIMQGLFMRI